MIQNFLNKKAEDIYHGEETRHARMLPRELHQKARRLLDQVNVITKVMTLQLPPSNHLEKLKGNYRDFWSLRINKQWRIIFRWKNGNAFDVGILDYH